MTGIYYFRPIGYYGTDCEWDFEDEPEQEDEPLSEDRELDQVTEDQLSPPDQEDDEAEYVIDAYVKVWASSIEQARELANAALVELYDKHRVDVELFDAYGVQDAQGNEIRPVG